LGLSIPEISNPFMELKTIQVNEQLNIRFFSKKTDNAKIILFDVNGRKVFEKSILVNEGINYQSFSFTGSQGMYVVTLTSENGSVREKVFVR